VAIRVNPDVQAGGHPHIATDATSTSSFGLDWSAEDFISSIAIRKMDPAGRESAAHIGSQDHFGSSRFASGRPSCRLRREYAARGLNCGTWMWVAASSAIHRSKRCRDAQPTLAWSRSSSENSACTCCWSLGVPLAPAGVLLTSSVYQRQDFGAGNRMNDWRPALQRRAASNFPPIPEKRLTAEFVLVYRTESEERQRAR